MPNQEEQSIYAQIDSYLESPKTFHLEMPLYHILDLSNGTVAEQAHKLLSHSGTMDAYCIWCDKESVFDADEYLYSSPFNVWRRESGGFRRNAYKCSRDNDHKYFIYYLKTKDHLLKIGQWPSVADFQIPQAEKYRKILGEDQYKEFTRGIGIAAHGVGIGSFVYLRRVFENLIEEAHAKAQAEIAGFSNEDYARVKMDEKIKMIKDYLPDFLVENRSLYVILSKGIHDLGEEECLKYFETVKLGIEQILDEKIMQKEKADKAVKAREAIQKVHGNLTNS